MNMMPPDYRLFTCSDCNGSGVVGRSIWVYEHGCAFGHSDTEEYPCPECHGEGVVEVEAAPIEMEDLDR
jgi:DnaJ-class molecular chaperone